MAKSTARAVRTAQAAKKSAKEDAQLLDNIAKLWAAHNTRSLQVRLSTGSLLNARLGEPTKRQPHGQSVLKQAAETVRIAESELNRMRWFAYFSKDEASCWGQTPPSNRTWSQFKAILPSLIAAVKGTERRRTSSGDRKKQSAVFDGLMKVLSSATSKLRADDFAVDGARKGELIGRLRDFAEAVSNRMGIRFYVETAEEDEAGSLGLTQAVVESSSELALSPCLTDTAAV